MLIIEISYEVSSFNNGIIEYKYFNFYEQAKAYYDLKVKECSNCILKEKTTIDFIESYSFRLEEFEK